MRKHLLDRVDDAIQSMPMLSCFVQDAQTRTPRYASLGALDAAQVVMPLQSVSPSLSSDDICDAAFNEVDPELANMATAPLWKVEVLDVSPSNDLPERHYWVVMTVHHALCDGRGAANLFEYLLAIPEKGAIVEGARALDCATLPASSNELVKPSLLFGLSKLFTEIIVPKVPWPLRPWLQQPSAWPASHHQEPADSLAQQKGITLTGKKRGKIIHFQTGTIAALKALARHNGVKTVHPLLHSACLVATALCARRGGNAMPRAGQLDIASATALSIRDVAREAEQSRCTGNFVGSFDWRCKWDPDLNFWDLTRSYASYITSDKSRIAARYGLGVLSFLPDSASHVSERAETPTQWEAWLYDKATARPPPFSQSFEISNLGKISVDTPKGRHVFGTLRNLSWRQRPAVLGYPFCVDVAGVSVDESGGDDVEATHLDLVMSIGWIEGVLPVMVDDVEDSENCALLFAEAIQRCVNLLAGSGRSTQRDSDSAGQRDSQNFTDMSSWMLGGLVDAIDAQMRE